LPVPNAPHVIAVLRVLLVINGNNTPSFITTWGRSWVNVDIAVIYDDPFTELELLEARASFSRGKAPGSDGIVVECLSALTDDSDLCRSVLAIINRVWETGQVESEWKSIVQIPIPKKGDLRSLDNWRPICLVNTVVKLMNRMIYNRLVPVVDSVMRDNQFGFRPSRSTASAQLILNEILVKSSREKRRLYLGFVDFSKAFPSISFASIRAALHAFAVPPRLSAMILSVYDGLRATVRTQIGDTEPFSITTGTLQGDVLAPFLFCMVLDRVLHAALDGHDDGLALASGGTKSRPRQGATLTDLDYADDIVLFAESADQLTRMLTRLVAEAARVNLHINVGAHKTAFMAFDEAAPLELLVPGLPPIPRVCEYRYLGQQKCMASLHASLEDRLRLAWAACHRCSPFWDMPLRVDTKLRIFDALIYPVLMYSLVTLPLTDTQCARIDRQLTRMRCVATRTKRWHDELPLNTNSLYVTTPRFPVKFRLERARLLGHSLRHSVICQRVISWRSRDAWGHRHLSPSETCARDLQLGDGGDLVDLALDRNRWKECINRLDHCLRQEVQYVPVTATNWSVERARARTLRELQYVEESHTLFPHMADELHIYTDGAAVCHATDSGCQSAAGAGLCIINNLGLVESTFSFPLLYDNEMTNNVAEIRAAVHAVAMAIERDTDLVLHTDSHVVWHFCHNLRASHRLVQFRGLDDRDELAALDDSIRHLVHRMSRNVYVVKVRGHNGNEGNFAADRAAAHAMALSGRQRYGSAFVGAPLIMKQPETAGRAVRACLKHVCMVCGRRYKTAAALKGHHTKRHGSSPEKKTNLNPLHEAAEDEEWSALQRALAAVQSGSKSRRRFGGRPPS